jgi:hypothetical protein
MHKKMDGLAATLARIAAQQVPPPDPPTHPSFRLQLQEMSDASSRPPPARFGR